MSSPIIERIATDRLKLRQWKTSDRKPFAELNGDPEVMELFHQTLEKEAPSP